MFSHKNKRNLLSSINRGIGRNGIVPIITTEQYAADITKNNPRKI